MDYLKNMTKGVTSLIDKTLGDPDEGKDKAKKDKKDKKEKKEKKIRETKSSSNSDNKS